MEDLVVQLSYEYPSMFRECAASPGRRAVPGVKRQAQLMCDRVGAYSIVYNFNIILLRLMLKVSYFLKVFAILGVDFPIFVLF